MTAQLNEAEEAEVDSLVLPVPQDWRGDFDVMRQGRLVCILVPYSKTFYRVDRGQQHGISYELGKALEIWLNQPHRLAQKSGWDQNVWFGNVEHAAARTGGRETVDYVGNIYNYYVAYTLAQDKIRQRSECSPQATVSR